MKSRTKRWMRLNEWSRVRIRRLIKGTGAGTHDRAQGTPYTQCRNYITQVTVKFKRINSV